MSRRAGRRPTGPLRSPHDDRSTRCPDPRRVLGVVRAAAGPERRAPDGRLVTAALLGAAAAGVVAGLAVAVPVGAVGALIVLIGARNGFRVAVAGGLGTATVDGCYALLAVLGGTGIAAVASSASGVLRTVAGVVLLVLAGAMAWSGWRARSSAPEGRRRTDVFGSPARAYRGLVAVTAVNPATILAFTAVVVGGTGPAGASSPAPPPVDAASASAAFVLGVLVGSAAWQTLLAATGALLGGVLAGPRGRMWTAFVGAAVTAGLAVRTMTGWP